MGDALLVTDHGILLTGLSAGTEYFLTVISQDGSGNWTESVEASFTTVSSDLDSDAEGMDDATDLCADTAAGDIVDTNGCSIPQLCPCDGPRHREGPWGNHDRYVACVQRETRLFVVAGSAGRSWLILRQPSGFCTCDAESHTHSAPPLEKSCAISALIRVRSS